VATQRHFYQKMFWFDFFGDTKDMNGFEQGVYALLIGNYFINRGPLPDDNHRLARMTQLSEEQWLSVRPAIAPKFRIRDGLWHHSRIERDLAEKEAEHKAKSEGARVTNAKRRAKREAECDGERPHLQLHSHSQSHSQLSSQVTATSKAILNEENVVRNALEVADEEELLRRTRDVVGEDEMKGKKFGFWRTLIRDHPRAYRDALTDAESRKKEALRGLPEAQIKKTWAHYMTYQFKEMKKSYET
jgi:uncharacterized protein YdaU (DUF1376 family)